jgi:peptidoglycan hydrolase-like protein with peptidoglycan-binding domain
LRILALLMIGSVLSLAAPDNPTPPQKKTQHTKKKASTKARTTPSKTTAKTSTKISGHHSKTAAKNSKTKSAASWRSRQLAPTADRYKEIQSALANKGYLNQPANGVWDSPSTEALRRFQHDQNLEPTGKLNSLSLIALGLGAKRTVMAAAPAAPPAVMTPRAPSIDAPPALPQNAIPQSPPPNMAVPELPATPPGDGR